MISLGHLLPGLLGTAFAANEPVMIFSARLDETGTDGRSPYTVVAGAVALADQWNKLEVSWARLLTRSNLPAYHWKEFNDPNDPIFGNWSRLRRDRFVEAQEKIVRKNTRFRVSVGVDGKAHMDVKRRMSGIKGFASESDYSICLRSLMFVTCEHLVKLDPDCRLTLLVEDGPWAAGAAQTYQRVAAMTGKWKPAKHAHRLAGFASAPKGQTLSLEAADYLAGTEHARILSKLRPKRGAETLSVLLDAPNLEKWYEGMMGEKESRRAYARSRKSLASCPPVTNNHQTTEDQSRSDGRLSSSQRLSWR